MTAADIKENVKQTLDEKKDLKLTKQIYDLKQWVHRQFRRAEQNNAVRATEALHRSFL